jgi:hypothetical protein
VQLEKLPFFFKEIDAGNVNETAFYVPSRFSLLEYPRYSVLAIQQ